MPHDDAVLCNCGADINRRHAEEGVFCFRLYEPSLRPLTFLPQVALHLRLSEVFALRGSQGLRKALIVQVAMDTMLTNKFYIFLFFEPISSASDGR